MFAIPAQANEIMTGSPDFSPNSPLAISREESRAAGTPTQAQDKQQRFTHHHAGDLGALRASAIRMPISPALRFTLYTFSYDR
jgi:hypothetical protein